MCANSEKLKKSSGKRVLKWILRILLTLFILLMIAIGIVVNFVFTPAKLTPLVKETATRYLNADVQIGKIELTFFSTFPDFGLKVTDVCIVSNVSRDTSVPPAACDSLIVAGRCLVTVNPLAYLIKNKVQVKDFILDDPHIYAYVDTAGVASWNIFEVQADTLREADTTAMAMPEMKLDIKNVRIHGGQLIFDDRSTQLYTRVDGLNLGIDGNFLGRTADLKLDMTTNNILFWQEGQLLVNKLALGLETGMSIDRDSLLYVLNKAVFDVNGVKFGGGGTLRADTVARTVAVDLKYGIHIPSLKTLLDLVPDTILRKDMKVEVRGDVLCTGTLKGLYGKKNVPLLTSQFNIKDGYVAYPGMPSKIEELNADLYAVVDLQKEQPSFVRLNRFCLKGGKTDIDLSGTIENILEDPVFKIQADAEIDFDDITRIFPLVDGITCRGTIETSLKSNVLLSDVQNGNYGKLKIGGWCKMSEVALFIPKDSIVVNVKSAGLSFTTNRKDKKIVQGVDLLNGVVGYAGLDINVKGKVRLQMDTTYLTFRTSPLRDTTAIASVSSALHMGRTLFIVRDTLLLGVKKVEAKAELMPSKKDKKVPRIEAEFRMDSLRVRSLGNRLSMAKADIRLNAVRSKRDKKIWFPDGYVDFEGLRAYTPYFPLRIKMPGTRIRFDRKEILLDSAKLKLGRSDLRLTGSITNLTKAFFKKEDLVANLQVRSDRIDCNQIMRALDAGTAYTHKVAGGFVDLINIYGDDMDKVEVVSDTVLYEGSNSVFVVPSGIDLTFQTDIKKVLFGKLVVDSIHGEVIMKNQCIQVTDLRMKSAAAKMDATLIYKATDTTRAYTGFALKMHDIQVDSLVRVIPSLDSLFPMLNSFKGVVDFHISAETWLDSNMMVELPTLRAAAYLDGHDLVLMDGETFSEISKMLMFKNKKRNVIDTISVDLVVKDGVVEIFPFMVEIDRYKVAVGGEHNIDMSFKYHVSLLKSPLPFRAGVDISGTLDKMKFKITKAKYKDLFIPSRRTKVDSSQLDLKKKIRTILRGGGENK